MPTSAASDYTEVVQFATRNVWTKYNASSVLRTLLDTWRRATFALEPSAGNPLPVSLQLFDQQVLDTENGLPTTPPAMGDDFQPGMVSNTIQRVAIAFRDSVEPTVAGNAALEAAFVAAFNATWT